MRRLILCFCCLLLVSMAVAQEDFETDFVEVDVTITSRPDAFGVEHSFAEGTLLNNGSMAYADINLFADVYDADDEVIGEGIGFLVRSCGEALLDFALQPGDSMPFSVQLEVYEADAVIDRVQVLTEATPVEPDPGVAQAEIEGITQASDAEVVAVEWVDESRLLYSTGCFRDVFTNRQWFEYNLSSGESIAVEHPRAADVTGPMREAVELGDPIIYNRSFLTFAPGQRRAIYQTELNTLASSEPDGTFRRLLYDALFNITLQGLDFHKTSGTAMAYYHGGYGDEVLYLLTNADGRQFSQHPINAVPSKIVPGFAANGRGLVIAATIDDVTGYFLKVPTSEQTILMFEGESPGNNWPAPFYEITADNQRWIFIARPVDGEPRLQCFNPDSQQLHDLSPLPLDLASDERAWMWLSPENSRMALAANGVNGGLWLIDLTRFEPCS